MFKKTTIITAAFLTLVTSSFDIAVAGNSKFKIGQLPKFFCTIGGPTEFRDIRVTNNSRYSYRRAMIYWHAKIGGKVLSGRYYQRKFSRGQTVSIPTGTGGSGVCQVKVRGR